MYCRKITEKHFIISLTDSQTYNYRVAAALNMIFLSSCNAHKPKTVSTPYKTTMTTFIEIKIKIIKAYLHSRITKLLK